MRILLPFFLAISGFSGAAAAALAADWSPKVFPRGPDREIIALRASGGTLYAGGAFGTFGPHVHRGLMRRDAQGWSPVGGGLEGTIRGIAVDGRGDVCVSGTFSRPDGTYGLAVWNGTEWSFPSDGKGLAGWGPIAAVGKAVYLVFESEPSEIYRWDGNALVSLEAKANGFIRALEGLGNELIAGGQFTAIGGVAGNHVARFGGRWEKMADGTPMMVRSLSLVEGVVVAAGGTADVPDKSVPGLAHWDGQKWAGFERLPSDRGVVEVVMGAAGRLYAGGYLYPVEDDPSVNGYGLAEWDGIQWKRIDDHVLNREIQALASVNGELWAGGRFYHPAAPQLARRSGNTWEAAYPSPNHGLSGTVRLLTARGGRLLAAGAFPGRSADSLTLISEWTGDGWARIGPDFPMGAYAASFVALEPHGAEVFLSAMFTSSGLPGLWRTSAAGAGPMGDIQGVQALRSTPGGLYAGGHFTRIGNVEAKHIARWDGSAWHPVGSGLGNPVTALEWDGSALYAAEANMNSLSGIPSQVSRFSGGQWTVLGTTAAAPLFNGIIHSLAAKGPEIWAAGEFRGNGLFNANGVAVWNGSAWQGAGEGLEKVLSLAISASGEVYAAGKFLDPSPGVAHWNGKGWEALGTGLRGSDASNPAVGKAAGCFNEDLFVGGDIDMAGGKPSAGLAIWTSRPEELGLARPARPTRSPKPVWRLFPDGRLRYVDAARPDAVFDALGRGAPGIPGTMKLLQ